MARFLKWLILLPVIFVALALALANRHAVTLYLDPFPNGGVNGPQLSAPFYLVLFLTLMVGVALGGVATWMGQGAQRRAGRRARAELRRVNAERARQTLHPAIEHRKGV
ncbi:conserved hypothetical protein [Methylocella silvestris BL2]|uniref:Lipopolysaccharide assembly protein A domain-containing protein n=1 Tax=Methylocella silvestris (strain DSM 15510 / CIP 108128 / LMG 27833 / NCIMB 13906 / BL2) TaxID=395965 RepID=B8EMZ1_METSB|nr:lipopolysaccharide assembly protein LapA domain-containing protein [Methylocella silvestris]ACK49126.1 conserved hypothetical protein [Methylocella silvestris BL2]